MMLPSSAVDESSLLSADEGSLRRILTEKPHNARVMAQLAVLLDRKAKSQRCPRCSSVQQAGEELPIRRGGRQHQDGHNCGTGPVRSEAMRLARQAVEARPDKPFGYWALSILLASHLERMDALRQAADRSTGVPHALALCRLLLEPRQEEAVRVRGVIATASESHPSRRKLNPSEEALYHGLESYMRPLVEGSGAKCSVGSTATPTPQQRVEMSLRDYSLGLFFRKMRPLERYQTRTLHHLQRAFRHLPASHPHKSLAAFWLATRAETTTAQPLPTITKCPPEYVTGLYSTFAERFDDWLVVKLAYETPTLLRRLWDDTRGSHPPSRLKRGLDLGCGTGLSGLAFRDSVQYLMGVDLSPEMLENAARRRCYDRLLLGDVIESIKPEDHERFDLVLACDVLVYIGDLTKLFEHVYGVLHDGGWWSFSTELLPTSGAGDPLPDDFRLLPTGRFAHSHQYISKLARESGFQVKATKVCPIRKNEGKDIIGCLAILAKP